MSRDDTIRRDRRRLLKGLIGVPALAAFGAGIATTRAPGLTADAWMKTPDIDAIAPPLPSLAGDPVRVGFVGVGRRGRTLLNLCLHADLNVAVAAVCDVFDVHANEALALARQAGHRPRRYRTYHAMVQSSDVDAVVIATPDHWHAPMALAAVQAGKHVYLERCLGNRLGDTLALYDAMRQSSVAFQLGHQHRQTEPYFAAQAALRADLLGHVRLVQASTRHAGNHGPWQAPVHEQASPRTIDWRQFLGSAPSVLFDAEHFFCWRRWWGYGAGLAGASLTKDFDRLNGTLGLGIPSAVVASGGIYAHRDGREVPDVFHVSMEFPDHGNTQEDQGGLALIYSATLAADHARHASLVGRYATLNWASSLMLEAEPAFTPPLLPSSGPRLLYAPRVTVANGAPTDADGQYTWRHGRLHSATYLHMREWFGCVRHGGTPSCGIEQGFEEAVTTQMATLAYRLGRRIEWDRQARRVRNVTRQELESLGMA